MLITILLALALGANADFQLQTIDGQTYYGELTGLDAQGVAFQTPQKKLTIPLGQLSDVSRVTKPQPPAAKPAVWIELVDGSKLSGVRYTVADRHASLELTNEQTLDLPTAIIADVRFQQFEGELSSQWAKITTSSASGDLIVVRKKGALDFQPGALGDITATTVAFTLDDEKLQVKRSKVAGLVYYHARREELPGSLCQLVDAAGSRLEVAEAKLANGSLKITTPAGLKRELPLGEVAALTARVQYLSDLEPESVHWLGFVSGPNMPDTVQQWFRPRFNQALDGGELKLGGTVFAKGVAMCSRTELVYRLPPGEFKRLVATAGIDARARPAGAVKLTIYGDDKPLVEKELLGSEEPLPIDIDLTGVSRLRIVADFGPGGEVMDLFDLCDARILQ
ncbi:MAG TPA: NPCBM/NEW2 domain-containing protein [Pirellulales bacterium]